MASTLHLLSLLCSRYCNLFSILLASHSASLEEKETVPGPSAAVLMLARRRLVNGDSYKVKLHIDASACYCLGAYQH